MNRRTRSAIKWFRKKRLQFFVVRKIAQSKMPVSDAPRNLVRRPGVLILAAVVALVVASVAWLVPFAPSNEAPVAAVFENAARVAKASRPALTAAEEKYIRELWPIHGDVERSTVRMSLGQIFYTTRDLSRADLGTRVKEASATYKAAEARLHALEPPASLRTEHMAYLSAVALFRESAAELLKMFSDGRDDHMLAAYPKSQEASNKIREVGGKFWPHEFPPH
jgi:hypothetical protein